MEDIKVCAGLAGGQGVLLLTAQSMRDLFMCAGGRWCLPLQSVSLLLKLSWKKSERMGGCAMVAVSCVGRSWGCQVCRTLQCSDTCRQERCALQPSQHPHDVPCSGAPQHAKGPIRLITALAGVCCMLCAQAGGDQTSDVCLFLSLLLLLQNAPSGSVFLLHGERGLTKQWVTAVHALCWHALCWFYDVRCCQSA